MFIPGTFDQHGETLPSCADKPPRSYGYAYVFDNHDIKYCQIDLVPDIIRVATCFKSILMSGSWIAIQFLFTQIGRS